MFLQKDMALVKCPKCSGHLKSQTRTLIRFQSTACCFSFRKLKSKYNLADMMLAQKDTSSNRFELAQQPQQRCCISNLFACCT